jgi:hypothetical protein
VVSDILIVSALANLCYPFIALWVWWKIKNKEAEKEKKAVERENRINGRMDELIYARERIAHEEGRKIGVAEGILIGQRS